MTRKLTRQERKEALAEWDAAIAEAESNYDADGGKGSWVDLVDRFQRSRAAALAKLEGQPHRDPWKNA